MNLVARPLTASERWDGETEDFVTHTSRVFPVLRGFGHGWQGQHNDDVTKAGMVRRLTPTECERLQSLPDGWTLPNGPSLASEPSYPHRVDESCPPPDSPRYAACGDAVTANVAEWIGHRLRSEVEQALSEREAA